jgi:hypothetical protein
MYTYPYPLSGSAMGDYHNPGFRVGSAMGDYHNPGLRVMGLGAAQGQSQAIEPVIGGVGGWGHIGLGAVAGLAAGWFIWKK